ncbi:tellurite resistance TerB family protein [Fulvivirga lutea]|uniref:Co-chaperone DjlA N-terminal domain-containing protein n=1 Tax=Fulvivirga lutea TaxID=2810512 RepID=A0A974ZZL6_9BACT|nr:hypothetical protein [Fulvivirga lutea]QSE96276.1 hypothetical protein JR347_11715 [Fulvivirga lutea]
MLNVNIEHFRNLISLAAADGKIADVEMVALSKIAYENGIPLDRLNVMIDRADEYVYLIPQNQQDRDQQMEDMIKLAMLDGEFANAERELINLVGGRLGFSPKEIRAKIDGYLKDAPSVDRD